MKYNLHKKRGFTLIELMIVIAIIGILMAYAIPAYRDYTVRSKRGECNAISDGLKTLIVENYTLKSEYPTNLADLGVSSVSGQNISISISGNTIICTPISTEAGTSTISWSVTQEGSLFNWACNDTGLAQQSICP